VSFADSNLYLISSLSLDSCKVFPFCSLLSDDEDLKRDAATAPLLDTLTVSKAPSQEDIAVVKSLEAPAKKRYSCSCFQAYEEGGDSGYFPRSPPTSGFS
jgi:hypothetical protein